MVLYSGEAVEYCATLELCAWSSNHVVILHCHCISDAAQQSSCSMRSVLTLTIRTYALMPIALQTRGSRFLKYQELRIQELVRQTLLCDKHFYVTHRHHYMTDSTTCSVV